MINKYSLSCIFQRLFEDRLFVYQKWNNRLNNFQQNNLIFLNDNLGSLKSHQSSETETFFALICNGFFIESLEEVRSCIVVAFRRIDLKYFTLQNIFSESRWTKINENISTRHEIIIIVLGRGRVSQRYVELFLITTPGKQYAEILLSPEAFPRYTFVRQFHTVAFPVLRENLFRGSELLRSRLDEEISVSFFRC